MSARLLTVVAGAVAILLTTHGKTNNMVNSEQVSQCIETLCLCGCDAVRATITAMESGAVVPQVESLSEEERQLVLDELRAVMAVYDVRQ